MQDYEIRKHYEAALHSLALMFGFQPRLMRNEFKHFLMEQNVIKQSTTELDDERLKGLADKLSVFHSRMENTPPEERGLLDFRNILKIETKTHFNQPNQHQNEFNNKANSSAA